MSEKNLTERMEEELDVVLRRQNDAEADARDYEQQYRRKQLKVTALDDEARRLRLALFVMTHEEEETYGAGDANKANLRRRNELKREPQS